MPENTFDFDELDQVEQAVLASGKSALCGDGRDTSQGDPNTCSGAEAPCMPDALAVTGNQSGGRKRMSKARAWFEIKRFFDAEPQQHYNSSDSQEWKSYYAKELLLKSAFEKLQSDGFVVIDALLSPEYLNKLAGELLLEAPEQAASLEDHLGAGRQGALGWVGDQEQVQRKALLHGREREQVALFAGRGESEHDRALCESCLLSLAHDRGSSSELRPRTKQQFFRFMKTYLHVVAEHSMSQVKVRPEEKIPVQFCFGNMPRPVAALTKPSGFLCLAEPTESAAVEAD